MAKTKIVDCDSTLEVDGMDYRCQGESGHEGMCRYVGRRLAYGTPVVLSWDQPTPPDSENES